MSRLRPYQTAMKEGVFQAWQMGHRNVLVKSATGTGKTVLFADIVKTLDRACAVIAHRSELVSQTSLALAREGVRHRVIGPDSLRKTCVTLHMDRLGRSFYDPTAKVGACGIDTLVNRDVARDPWFAQVGAWVQDEAHHLLRENKWGKGIEMFPNAFGLGVSATLHRADGKGLGRDADGVFDVIVNGPEMRDQIEAGYLTDYRVYAPPSDVDYSQVTVTASGDLSPAKLRAAVHASDKIVGDVVRNYIKICEAKLGRLGLGVTFAVDVESAKEIAVAFNAAGVPAEIVSAKTPDLLRAQILRRFERREVMQLVNVDLFGEGFDLPAIEVVSMVRKTESWPLFVQQFGRALRLMISDELMARWGTLTNEERLAHIAASKKPFALIIDHVGNVIRHGLPDAPRVETLAGRNKRSTSASDAIPMRTCANVEAGPAKDEVCGKDYERFHKACPYCGHEPEPAARTAPEFVDGDLNELDEATLAALRGKVIDLDVVPMLPINPLARAGANARIYERNQAQGKLRAAMSLWSGWQSHLGRNESQQDRLFYLLFKVDKLTAQSLGATDATALNARIDLQLSTNGVTEK